MERAEKQFYSVKEVATMLGVTRNAVYIRVQKGEIPHKRLGTRILIPKKFIDENFLAEG